MWREELDENAAVWAAFEIVCSCSLYPLVIHQIKPCAKLEYAFLRLQPVAYHRKRVHHILSPRVRQSTDGKVVLRK